MLLGVSGPVALAPNISRGDPGVGVVDLPDVDVDGRDAGVLPDLPCAHIATRWAADGVAGAIIGTPRSVE